jgi:hypothetical protein
MGQTIEVLDKIELGETLLISSDRSWSGQDGEAFSQGLTERKTFPAELAARLFDAGLGIDHVYVMSNTVSIRRPGGWDSEAIATAAAVISSFFRFYGEQPPTEQPLSEEAPALS